MVLCENVNGHVSMGLDEVLSELESAGYSAEPVIIPACAVNAQHRRDRVWILAYSDSIRQQGQRLSGRRINKEEDTDRQTNRAFGGSKRNATKWNAEPSVGRVANGIPNRMDRLKGLGNAIVPQVAAEILRVMMTVDSYSPNLEDISGDKNHTPSQS